MAAGALTRKPAFWVAYVVTAVAALAIAWQLFPLAIPVLHLDIKLARGEAIAKARTLALRQPLLPSALRVAARFTHDEAVQNYVELEGGGKAAFAALVDGDVYSPYRWEVRLFAPGETTEETVRFHPDGAPLGFSLRLPETFVPADRAGLALDRAAAQALAERTARDDWGVDFGAYRLLEATDQTRTTGRVDHAFVYERTAGHLGDARFRLRVAVAGNVLVEVAPFAFIPESFDRRFSEMRSANNAIAAAASVVAVLLYGIGGCVIGVLWLARRHWLLWRPALAAGFAVGALLGAASLADIPGAWFGFDTAQSVTSFWLREVGKAAAAMLGGGVVLGLVFMAAESLSRRAFAAHPQLWRVASREAAPTTAIVGRTLGGYLFVSLELAFIAAFYAATNRWLGWWQPSEVLTDPEILGSAVPALGPIAMSLQAGFMEESLFRAVPLSLAALIGERFGRRTTAIAIAVVVQALVFAGGHASYPGFPSYSRVVELFVPAIVWALIFLRFGLVPTILLHWLFDLILMSIPLFLVDAPGALASRALAIGVALVPLGVILARRIARGAWGELPDSLRNGAWQPAVPSLAPEAAPAPVDRALPRWAARFQQALVPLGVVGLGLWMRGHAVSRRCPSTSDRSRRSHRARGCRARCARSHARPRMAALRHGAARAGQFRALGGPCLRLARSGTGCLREADRRHAAAADVGSPLCALRRRRRGTRRGVAGHARRQGRDPAGAARVARGRPRRAPCGARTRSRSHDAPCASASDSSPRRLPRSAPRSGSGPCAPTGHSLSASPVWLSARAARRARWS